MSKLIVVCGLGGSGKTTTARELSKRLNIVCLHKDLIKSAVYDVLNIQTPKALDLLLRFTEHQISNNVDLIIEGTFNYPEDAEVFENFINKYHIDLWFVVCNVDIQTRIGRIKSRDRHVCHQDADKKLLSQIETEKFDYSIMPGKHINITTNKPTTEIITEIIDKLSV